MAKRKYKVVIAPEARDDLKREATYIRRKWSDKRAKQVQNGILDEIDKLDTLPNRNPVHKRISDDDRTYRFIPKWAYMIIYRVEELLKRVRVVGIFSTDQDPENVDEIKGR